VSPATATPAPLQVPHKATGRVLAGFLVSGFLLALLGAILPAWGYHRDPPDFVTVGNYFLCFALGMTAAAKPARAIMARRGVAFLLILSCQIACASLIYLALVSPPLSAWWRAGGLLALGFGAGLLNSGLFHGIPASYEAGAAGALSRGGIWYGLGSVVATLLAAAAFYGYRVTTMLALMAVVPAVFAVIYYRSGSLAAEAAPLHQPTLREAVAEFRSVGAVLFALILFFQCGNEWSVAGWLPLFLIRRLGLSPQQALVTLALYSLFLVLGRFGAIALLPRVRHGRLLVASVLSALFGCLILFTTDTGFGAVSGVFFIGAGYASIYPLLAEAIGRRFPYYHPGLFSGIFSLALLGALLAPASLGYAASRWGVGVVIGIPLLGTCMVMVLILGIWLESKVTGR
jgi:MFS transporter, FHS family, glucose/mannose:H+ symporter